MLALESQASIFFSYARESAVASGALSGLGEYGGNQYTVLVPTNKAIMALSRKPHQLNSNDDVEITDEEADRRSAEKVQRWISAHIIPAAVELKDGAQGVHQTLLDGKSLTFTHLKTSKSPEWTNWKVDDHAILAERKASNGIMYLIDGAVEV
ncbi:SubName: Full=Uncharacterized protein {ECO:0000313/EMBL:CCA70424.1} [Serendipita indica DSM 11827]|nr:SubName: Full=Uncharacterized protein {ECO:0000313/EMBL:CCA70424.1} [Serendipita indica DSM 11827]